MVVDDTIAQALNRIADGLEENNEVLKRIANHYDGVVPVMTRNAKRVEEAHEEQEKGFTQGLKDMFTPVREN
jgi:hypothetical protein